MYYSFTSNCIQGTSSYVIFTKKINNNQTDVVLNYLKEEEKLEAIAGLFSGENISVESISTVKEFREKARG